MAYNDIRYLGAASGYTAAQSGYAPTMGIGGMYDTPGYGEGYRPAYGESVYDPYNPWYQGRGPGSYLWNAANALGPGLGYGTDLPYYQNASMNTQYAGNVLGNYTSDAAMNFAQQYALPIGAYYAGYKIHQAAKVRAMGSAGGIMSFFTGNQAPRVHLGTAFGERLGTGVGRTIGGTAGFLSQRLVGVGSAAGGARIAGGVLSAIGAGIGAAAAPALIGMGLSSAADAGIFQPYIDTRRMSTAIQTNLSNRIITGSNGAANNGLGMSAVAATNIASGISNSAWDDFGFSNAQYSSLVDYGMQGGLYNDLGSGSMSSRNMVDRTKKLAADVKKVMEVFGEKDMREAVGLLSQFAKQGGITGSYETTSSLNSLRMGTLMTGKSAREIYDVIGSAGAGAASSVGITGIAGLMSAASTYAGMTNANRMGLISSRMLSMLGGAEGATNLATNAKMMLGLTDYNQMALYSQFYGAGAGTNMAQNITNFAMASGRNPLAAAGNMALHGAEMRDAQMRGNPLSVYQPMMQMLRTMYPGRKSFSEAELAAVMQGQGMDGASIKAAMLEISNAKRGFGSDVMAKAQADAYRQHIEGSGFSYFGDLGRNARYALYGAGQSMGHLGEKYAQFKSYFSDAISSGIDRFRFGTTDTSDFSAYYGGNSSPYSVFDLSSRGMSTTDVNIAKRINNAASGVAGADARDAAQRFITSGGSKDDVISLYKMLGEDISSSSAYDFALASSSFGRGKVAPTSASVRGDDTSDSQLALFAGSSQPYRLINGRSSYKSRKKDLTKQNTFTRLKGASKDARDAYMAMTSMYVKGASPDKVAEYLNSLPESLRRDVAGILGDVPIHERAYGKNWGPVEAGALNKRLKEVLNPSAIDSLLKNSEAAQDIATRVVENKDGSLRAATLEEQEAMMRQYGHKVSAATSKGALMQQKFQEQLANVKAGAASQGFQDLMLKNVASMDGTGDGAARTMATAADVFSAAVSVFASESRGKTPEAVQAQINTLIKRNMTAKEE